MFSGERASIDGKKGWIALRSRIGKGDVSEHMRALVNRRYQKVDKSVASTPVAGKIEA